MNAEEQNQHLVKRYTKLAIVCCFLLALLWPLGSFICWILLGAISYFFFLTFYYNLQTKEEPDLSHPNHQTEDFPKGIQNLFNLPLAGYIIIAIALIVIVFIMAPFNRGASNEDESEKPLSNITNEGESNVDSLINRGVRFYNRGQYEPALNHFEKALKLEPQNQFAVYDKALVYYSQKNYSRSVKTCYQCLRNHPDYGYAYYLLGDNYEMLQQADSAIISFENAYRYEVRDAALLQNMADVYYEKKNSQKAIRYYKEALQQDSSITDLYMRLSELEPSRSQFYQAKAIRWKQ